MRGGKEHPACSPASRRESMRRNDRRSAFPGRHERFTDVGSATGSAPARTIEPHTFGCCFTAPVRKFATSVLDSRNARLVRYRVVRADCADAPVRLLRDGCRRCPRTGERGYGGAGWSFEDTRCFPQRRRVSCAMQTRNAVVILQRLGETPGVCPGGYGATCLRELSIEYGTRNMMKFLESGTGAFDHPSRFIIPCSIFLSKAGSYD